MGNSTTAYGTSAPLPKSGTFFFFSPSNFSIWTPHSDACLPRIQIRIRYYCKFEDALANNPPCPGALVFSWSPSTVVNLPRLTLCIHQSAGSLFLSRHPLQHRRLPSTPRIKEANRLDGRPPVQHDGGNVVIKRQPTRARYRVAVRGITR